MTFKHTVAQARKIWYDALLSGKYKQCRNSLRTGPGEAAGHCCLDVAICEFMKAEPEACAACELTDCFEAGEYRWRDPDGVHGEELAADTDLPGPVAIWLGYGDPAGTPYGYSKDDRTFIYLNDEEEMDFEQIANFILTPSNRAELGMESR